MDETEQREITEQEERQVWARVLKREGAGVDGEIYKIPISYVKFCSKCDTNMSKKYSEKYGLTTKALTKDGRDFTFCDECKGFVGKCFVCNLIFESEKDLSNDNKTQILCTNCK